MGELPERQRIKSRITAGMFADSKYTHEMCNRKIVNANAGYAANIHKLV